MLGAAVGPRLPPQQADDESTASSLAASFDAEAAAFARLGCRALHALAARVAAEGCCGPLTSNLSGTSSPMVAIASHDATDDRAIAELAARLAVAWQSPRTSFSSTPSPLDALLTPTLPPKLQRLRLAFADPRAFGRFLSLLLARLIKLYLEAFVRAAAAAARGQHAPLLSLYGGGKWVWVWMGLLFDGHARSDIFTSYQQQNKHDRGRSSGRVGGGGGSSRDGGGWRGLGRAGRGRTELVALAAAQGRFVARVSVGLIVMMHMRCLGWGRARPYSPYPSHLITHTYQHNHQQPARRQGARPAFHPLPR